MRIVSNKLIFFIATLFIVCLPAMTLAALVPCTEPIGGGGAECNFDALGQLLVNVVRFALALGLTFSAIAFAWAGVLYLTAGGDSGKVEKAHDIFGKVIVGFIIALAAFVIVDLIADALNLQSFIKDAYNSFI